MTTHTIKAKNCRIDVIDQYGDDQVYLNMYFNTKPKGEYEQVVLPRRIAKVLGILLQGED